MWIGTFSSYFEIGPYIGESYWDKLYVGAVNHRRQKLDNTRYAVGQDTEYLILFVLLLYFFVLLPHLFVLQSRDLCALALLRLTLFSVLFELSPPQIPPHSHSVSTSSFNLSASTLPLHSLQTSTIATTKQICPSCLSAGQP